MELCYRYPQSYFLFRFGKKGNWNIIKMIIKKLKKTEIIHVIRLAESIQLFQYILREIFYTPIHSFAIFN